MTARICGRYPAEIRAVAAAAAATEPEPASLSHAAGLLAFRAGADARFASGFLPWLAAAQMLVIPDIGEDGAVSNQSVTGRPFDPAMTPSARLPGSRGGVAAMAQ